MIFEDKSSYKEAIKDTVQDVLIYHISQPQLVEKLRDHIIIECNLEEVVTTPRYERIKKFEFSQLLNDAQHPIGDILMNSLLFLYVVAYGRMMIALQNQRH